MDIASAAASAAVPPALNVKAIPWLLDYLIVLVPQGLKLKLLASYEMNTAQLREVYATLVARLQTLASEYTDTTRSLYFRAVDTSGHRTTIQVEDNPTRAVPLYIILYTHETRRGVAVPSSLAQVLDFFKNILRGSTITCCEIRVGGRVARMPSNCELPDMQTEYPTTVMDLHGRRLNNLNKRHLPWPLDVMRYGDLRLHNTNTQRFTDPVSMNVVPQTRAVYIGHNAEGTVKQLYHYDTLKTVLERARQAGRLVGPSPLTRRHFGWGDVRRYRASTQSRKRKRTNAENSRPTKRRA